MFSNTKHGYLVIIVYQFSKNIFFVTPSNLNIGLEKIEGKKVTKKYILIFISWQLLEV